MDKQPRFLAGRKEPKWHTDSRPVMQPRAFKYYNKAYYRRNRDEINWEVHIASQFKILAKIRYKGPKIMPDTFDL